MKDEDDLKRKIEELERENRALRSAVAGTGKRNVIVVSEGSYQGHPTITFEVSGRPFTLGLRKASVVLYCSELVEIFVKRHKGEIKDLEIVRGSADNEDKNGKADVQI